MIVTIWKLYLTIVSEDGYTLDHCSWGREQIQITGENKFLVESKILQKT